MTEGVPGLCDPATVLRAAWRALLLRDKSAMLDLATDDIVYAIYVPNHLLPFAGETVGKAALSDRLQMMIEQFQILKYEGVVMGTEGDIVRGQVAYHFRHRVTGKETEGTMRQVVQIRDGRIASFKTYKDVEGVGAFMNVVSQSAADQRNSRKPDRMDS